MRRRPSRPGGTCGSTPATSSSPTAVSSQQYLDRRNDVVRRRGENISSAELESIAAAHDQVADVAVIGVPSRHTEEDIKLVVVPREPAFDDALDIWSFLEQRAPRFMLPRYVEFVRELPKTPTLKVRKGELRAAGVSGRLHDLRCS